MVSECYEEVVFNEPVEAFYDLLTSSGGPVVRGKGSKGSKQASMSGKKAGQEERVAELPFNGTHSQKEEGKELDRLGQAIKTVELMVREERRKLEEREKTLADLKSDEGLPTKAK